MEYLIPAEVCAKLRVRPRTLEIWRSRGVGPAYVKVEGRVLYPSDLLEQYIAARITK